jgi:prepilin peptidase CpaA
MFEKIINIFLCIVTVMCVFWDLKYRRIPNFVTLPVMFTAPVIYGTIQGISALKSSLSGLVVGLLIFFIPFILGGMGGGDVKFLAVVGALKGTAFVLNAAIYSAFAGGIMAVLFLLYRGELFILLKKWIYTLINIMAPGAVRMARTEKTDVGKQVLPYGLAIGIGVMTAMIING